MSTFAIEKLLARLPEAVQERYTDRTGAPWAVIAPEHIAAALSLLKKDPELGFTLFLSMDAVDRLQLPESSPRFEVIYLLRSLQRAEVVRLKVRVAEDSPAVPSVTPIFQGADWWERFVWDFYGIQFIGHPNLRRVLLYEEFKGHPLRKDYALRDRQPLTPERKLQDIFRGPGTSGLL